MKNYCFIFFIFCVLFSFGKTNSSFSKLKTTNCISLVNSDRFEKNNIETIQLQNSNDSIDNYLKDDHTNDDASHNDESFCNNCSKKTILNSSDLNTHYLNPLSSFVHKRRYILYCIKNKDQIHSNKC